MRHLARHVVPLLAVCTPVLAAPAGAPAPKKPLPAHAAPKPLVCAITAAAPAAKGNPEARHAAQRGLDYLARSATAWTRQHTCFGCHVQAVTLEALTVGRRNQYGVAAPDLETMVQALLRGVTAGGRVTGAAFEGQAWARYDQLVDGQRTPVLLRYAAELVGYQQQDGSVLDDDARLPVTGGTMHTTYQAMQTWRQAFARTADDKWLGPMRRAERYLAAQSASWSPKSEVYLQNVNFALLGLVAAGVGPGEESSRRLQRLLLARQNQDGGWGLERSRSDALATGQTLSALKLAGFTDGDGPIARGTRWLVQHQSEDGAWRTVRSGQNGAEKGEGMWAVLGLVSVDVISVQLAGLIDGQRVAETVPLTVDARDNLSGGVAKVELLVDDLPVHGACGPSLRYAWDTRGLATGKHVVDVVATNQKGQVSRRRFAVYAGDIFLTDVGTRFDEARQATEVSLRHLGPSAERAGRVELAVYTVEGSDNHRGRKVYGREQQGAPGPMTFTWTGVGSDGQAQPPGRYFAELSIRDDQGQVRQRESTLFAHESEQAQRTKFAEVEGRLSLRSSVGVAANTVVELVDRAGRVVQSVRSTEQGNYRFKNVAGGQYKVRARKDGFAADEVSLEARPAAAATKADVAFH